jgi:hypothetical protein
MLPPNEFFLSSAQVMRISHTDENAKSLPTDTDKQAI